MSLMNFLQLSSTTLLHANTNINNVDNLFAKELQTIPLILNMYDWNYEIYSQHSCSQSIIDNADNLFAKELQTIPLF